MYANRDVSFAGRGEIVGLIGRNGAGKTTLFNLVTGFIRPDAGTVRFAGADVTGMRPDRLCHLGVARTFQILKPFPRLTLAENVMIGALARGGGIARAREAAARCLALVGLEHRVDALARELSPASASASRWRARSPPGRSSCCSTRSPAASTSRLPGLIALVGRLRDEGVTLLVIEHNMRVIMGLADRSFPAPRREAGGGRAPGDRVAPGGGRVYLGRRDDR